MIFKTSLPVWLLVVVIVTLTLAHPAWAVGPVFENPLGSGATVLSVLTKVINALLGFIGILAMLALVWGAIMIITAFGDDKKITAAKGIIFWSIAGIALAIVSYAIINTIRKAFGIV